MWTGRQRDEEKFNGLLARMQERGNMADRQRREESEERERERCGEVKAGSGRTIFSHMWQHNWGGKALCSPLGERDSLQQVLFLFYFFTLTHKTPSYRCVDLRSFCVSTCNLYSCVSSTCLLYVFSSGFLAPAHEHFAPNPVQFYEFCSDVTACLSGRFPMSDVPATSG